MNKNKRLIYISLLAAQGVVITMLERAIPFPFAFAPGAKRGLANIITLLAIFTLPYKDSFKVVWMRLLISTLLGGTLSTFLYSFAGAFLSYGGMLLVRLLGPTFGSEAGQHDRHQCDRWDSAQFMVWVAQRTSWTSTAVQLVCVQPLQTEIWLMQNY